MIRFLRHIRHRFLANNQLSKYVFYALGEIALVMVGILLALQVNNWNQERNNRKSETFYLKKLKSNLSEDMLLIQSQIDQIHFENGKLDTLTFQLASVNPIEIDGNDMLYLLSTSTLLPERSAFDNLKFTSNLSLLQNDILIDQLIGYYAQWEGTTVNWQQSIKDYARNTIAPYIMSNYPLVFQDQPNIHELVPSEKVWSTVAAKDLALKNFIAYRFSANNAILGVYHSNIEMASDLLKMIDEGL